MDDLELRKVNIKDIDLIYEWANDDETRAQSFSTAKISYEDHTKWFNDKIVSEDTLFYIMENKGEPAGTVRLDLKDNTGYISYSIAPSVRGRGLGVVILKLLEEKVKEYNKSANDAKKIKKLLGEVKGSNKASQRIFEFLNYEDDPSDSKDIKVYTKTV